MFISSSSGQNHSKTTESQSTTKSAPVVEREKKRYQYLFQSQSLQKNKTIYQHVIRIVNQLITQFVGRPQEQTPQGSKQGKPNNATEQREKPRQIRGIADRMPRLVDPDNPRPRRDSVFIGEAKDYPAAVIGIEYGGNTHPVFYEGNQIVARHLHLDSEESLIEGRLVLNDGSHFPVEIMVITAV